jgi:hypothetical protein
MKVNLTYSFIFKNIHTVLTIRIHWNVRTTSHLCEDTSRSIQMCSAVTRPFCSVARVFWVDIRMSCSGIRLFYSDTLLSWSVTWLFCSHTAVLQWHTAVLKCHTAALRSANDFLQCHTAVMQCNEAIPYSFFYGWVLSCELQYFNPVRKQFHWPDSWFHATSRPLVQGNALRDTILPT